ncbi:unnamed protein product [Rotaria sp. Silwood1]|nr:unnamed protein product [Rotaria sp. Silwood1]CAF3336002.1 unnamed protein product [Rotaria sp. Silwood1]CAF3348929.1 unnamed protein product [Rotaria sp. Silwood1]CAF4608175.1 unnamed protein product [Rotaria sp. Silwood1]CAF4659862.1 unnamed protein product [Rotaria sp. Silwood1]
MQESECLHNEPLSNDYHLEYLDEFLQLRCAPDLITMGLFPNSKEITETFAVWSALRRHIFPQLSTSISSTDNRQNAIIVVGDGMTPRTAALCAFLTKGLWQCYSIDPMLQYDTYADMTFINRRSITTADHCKEWKSIKGLRMARAKIQTVSIQCRNAIVVMMHAHVAIEDAIAAVDASEGIIGIVTCPCCKWAPYQQEWLGQAPHHQYTDLRLLSVKNQMNVWYFPQGCHSKLPNISVNSISSTMTEHKQLPSERNIWGIDTSMIENVLSTRDGVKQRAIELWPQIFSKGIEAFNVTDVNQLSDTWPWASTTWSPKDILPFMKSCSAKSTSSSSSSSDDVPLLPSWFRKPVLLVGTIAAMRRCKHTIFYELNTCAIPSEELEDILRLTCHTLSTINIFEEKIHASNDTFPALLKSADRMWTCVEYQRHLQAVAAYDPTVERKTKNRNLQTTTTNNITQSPNIDRVNVILSLLSYERKTPSTVEHTTTSTLSQTRDHPKVKLFDHNPQPQQSLFPWAMYLRPGDILVAYCELGRNASQGPQLCLIDGILLFDSMLHMIGVDRRILQ